MKFYNRSQFASWFETETKKYVGHSGTWVAPSEYEKAAKLILGKINAHIEIPSPYGTGGWESVYRYGEKIWDKNQTHLNGIESPASTTGSYSSNYSSSTKPSSGYSSQGSCGTCSSYNLTSSSYSSASSSSSTPQSSSGTGIVKRHNFDSALRKIQNFSNEVPYIPELEKFETVGGLFGWGDHHVNGSEMNRYVEKVQDLFRMHNGIIIKTIQEFRDVYNTFDYLDREYLTGIIQTASAAAKASEGAKAASNQAMVASDQAKAAAEKALKNEEDLKKDVDNLRKLVEKIRSIKEDLSSRIESTNTSLSHKLRKMEQDLSAQLLLQDEIIVLQNQLKTIDQLEKKVSDWEHILINEVDKLTQRVEAQKIIIEELTKRFEKAEKKTLSENSPQNAQESVNNSYQGLIWAYIIGGLGLVCSICSLILR